MNRYLPLSASHNNLTETSGTACANVPPSPTVFVLTKYSNFKRANGKLVFKFVIFLVVNLENELISDVLGKRVAISA